MDSVACWLSQFQYVKITPIVFHFSPFYKEKVITYSDECD